MLHGIHVAAVTARREGPELDLGGTFELIDYLSSSGVSGIALMGSTGEFLHFSMEERIRLAMLGVKRSRVPVVVGVAHSTLDGAVALARECSEAGAAGLLLLPPYFFRYSQEDVREFYLRFAEGVKDAAPVYLYNIPAFTTPIAVETALDLLKTGRFAGIKDSSGDWECFERLQAARAGMQFTLLVGNDAIYRRARVAGADGVVSGCACAIPEAMAALDRAITAGDAARADRLETRLREFIGWIDCFPTPVGIREALSVRGLRVGPSAPLGASGRERLAAFRQWFKEWLPLVQKESKS